MEKWQGNVLKRCEKRFMEDMDAEKVLLRIAEPLSFTSADQNDIKAKNLTQQEQCKSLLKKLPTKGDKAYEVFKEAIKEFYPHLTNTILEAGK